MNPTATQPRFPCSHCQQPLAADARVCTHCGAVNALPKLRSEGVCPRCRVALDYHLYRDTPINPCGQCQGIWIEQEHFEWLTSQRDVFADPSIPRRWERPPLPPAGAYVPCPCCDDYMVRINFKRISSVMVDHCRDHGIWLDAGELEQIRCFIANGGLEKAQRSELNEVRSDLQSLANDFRDAEFTRRALQKPSFKFWLFS